MKKRNWPPCMLVVDGKEYILTDVNERRVKSRLYELYEPDQEIEEWVDGQYSTTLQLQDIFNQ